MRLQLNLNRYYEGLEPWQVNGVFSRFVCMKPDISRVKYLLNCPKEKMTVCQILWHLFGMQMRHDKQER